MSNLFWLISVDMPISIGIFFLTYLDNLMSMNLAGAIPLIALVAIGFLIAYSVAKIILIWIKVSMSSGFFLMALTAILKI